MALFGSLCIPVVEYLYLFFSILGVLYVDSDSAMAAAAAAAAAVAISNSEAPSVAFETFADNFPALTPRPNTNRADPVPAFDAQLYVQRTVYVHARTTACERHEYTEARNGLRHRLPLSRALAMAAPLDRIQLIRYKRGEDKAVAALYGGQIGEDHPEWSKYASRTWNSLPVHLSMRSRVRDYEHWPTGPEYYRTVVLEGRPLREGSIFGMPGSPNDISALVQFCKSVGTVGLLVNSVATLSLTAWLVCNDRWLRYAPVDEFSESMPPCITYVCPQRDFQAYAIDSFPDDSAHTLDTMDLYALARGSTLTDFIYSCLVLVARAFPADTATMKIEPAKWCNQNLQRQGLMWLSTTRWRHLPVQGLIEMHNSLITSMMEARRPDMEITQQATKWFVQRNGRAHNMKTTYPDPQTNRYADLVVPYFMSHLVCAPNEPMFRPPVSDVAMTIKRGSWDFTLFSGVKLTEIHVRLTKAWLRDHLKLPNPTRKRAPARLAAPSLPRRKRSRGETGDGAAATAAGDDDGDYGDDDGDYDEKGLSTRARIDRRRTPGSFYDDDDAVAAADIHPTVERKRGRKQTSADRLRKSLEVIATNYLADKSSMPVINRIRMRYTACVIDSSLFVTPPPCAVEPVLSGTSIAPDYDEMSPGNYSVAYSLYCDRVGTSMFNSPRRDRLLFPIEPVANPAPHGAIADHFIAVDEYRVYTSYAGRKMHPMHQFEVRRCGRLITEAKADASKTTDLIYALWVAATCILRNEVDVMKTLIDWCIKGEGEFSHRQLLLVLAGGRAAFHQRMESTFLSPSYNVAVRSAAFELVCKWDTDGRDYSATPRLKSVPGLGVIDDDPLQMSRYLPPITLCDVDGPLESADQELMDEVTRIRCLSYCGCILSMDQVATGRISEIKGLSVLVAGNPKPLPWRTFIARETWRCYEQIWQPCLWYIANRTMAPAILCRVDWAPRPIQWSCVSRPVGLLDSLADSVVGNAERAICERSGDLLTEIRARPMFNPSTSMLMRILGMILGGPTTTTHPNLLKEVKIAMERSDAAHDRFYAETPVWLHCRSLIRHALRNSPHVIDNAVFAACCAAMLNDNAFDARSRISPPDRLIEIIKSLVVEPVAEERDVARSGIAKTLQSGKGTKEWPSCVILPGIERELVKWRTEGTVVPTTATATTATTLARLSPAPPVHPSAPIAAFAYANATTVAAAARIIVSRAMTPAERPTAATIDPPLTASGIPIVRPSADKRHLPSYWR